MHQSPDLIVFYDGYCPLCSHEISSYKRLKLASNIMWLDLAASANALQSESFDLAHALALLHVKDVHGRLHIGLAAHLLLWQHLPGFQWRARVLQQSTILLSLCNSVYLFFTRHRPGLKRRARVAAQRAIQGANS